MLPLGVNTRALDLHRGHYTAPVGVQKGLVGIVSAFVWNLAHCLFLIVESQVTCQRFTLPATPHTPQ